MIQESEWQINMRIVSKMSIFEAKKRPGTTFRLS
jgi:hypothetical protein